MTDEDSVFFEFEQPDLDKPFPRTGNRTPITKDKTKNPKEIKSILKRFTEKSKTYEFLIKFDVEVKPEKKPKPVDMTKTKKERDAEKEKELQKQKDKDALE